MAVETICSKGNFKIINLKFHRSLPNITPSPDNTVHFNNWSTVAATDVVVQKGEKVVYEVKRKRVIVVIYQKISPYLPTTVCASRKNFNNGYTVEAPDVVVQKGEKVVYEVKRKRVIVVIYRKISPYLPTTVCTSTTGQLWQHLMLLCRRVRRWYMKSR